MERSSSYRYSHINKGEDYDNMFKFNSHRSMMWALEREALDNIIDKYFVLGIHHLDFACGTGRILAHMEKRVETSTGVDISASMLSVARKNAPRSQLIQADITETNNNVLNGQQFNLITSFRFFPNAEPDLRRSALFALTRCLSKDGILVFNNHRKKNSMSHLIARLVNPQGKPWVPSQEMEGLVRSANLQIVEIRYLGFFPATDRFTPLPTNILLPLERASSGFSFLRGMAQNWIYVCRKCY